MVKKAIVNRKIQTISNAIEFINKYKDISYGDFQTDIVLQSALLYQLEKSIQALIDLLFHIVSDEGWGVVLHKSNLADLLVQHKVIEPKYKDVFIKIYGFRNRLVHEYEDMDLKIIFQVLQQGSNDIVAILHQVMDYLKV